MRNARITSTIRKNYRQTTSDSKPLEVACVSNAHYAVHINGYDAEAIPISIHSTGIPNLRTSLSWLTAKSKLYVLQQYRYGVLPDIIGSIEIWSSKSATKRRSELRQIAGKPREVSVFLLSPSATLTYLF